MSRTVPINGERLRRAIADLEVADRAFSRATPVGQSALRSMMSDNAILGSFTISDVRRVADEAGLTFGELFDPIPDEDAEESPEADVRALAQLLFAQSTRQQVHRVAVALGWDLDRLRDTIATLNTRLDPLGLRVHTNGMGVRLKPADDTTDGPITALALYKDADEGMDANQARVLFAIYAHRFSKTRVPRHQMWHLGRLERRRMVEYGDGNRLSLTEEVQFCLAVSASGEDKIDRLLRPIRKGKSSAAVAVPSPSQITTPGNSVQGAIG